MKTSSSTQPTLATSAAQPPPLWRIRLQAIAWFVLLAALVLGLPVLLGWGYGLLILLVLAAAVLAVAYDVEKALSEGCVSYNEGVQTPTPESKVFFEKLSHELVGGSDLRRDDPAFAKAHASDFQRKPATNDNAFMLMVVEWLKRGSASQKALGGVTCPGAVHAPPSHRKHGAGPDGAGDPGLPQARPRELIPAFDTIRSIQR